MNEKLTLKWIIDALKKSGIGSKQIVIDRLEKIGLQEVDDLLFSVSDLQEKLIDEYLKENKYK